MAAAARAAHSHGLTFSDAGTLVGAIEQLIYDDLKLDPRMVPFPMGSLAAPAPPPRTRPFSRLALISPAEHPTFSENVRALAAAFDEYFRITGVRIPYDIVHEPPEGDEEQEATLCLTFVLGEPRTLPRHYISYGMEQVPFVDPHRSSYHKLRGAVEVWEHRCAFLDGLGEGGVVIGGCEVVGCCRTAAVLLAAFAHPVHPSPTFKVTLQDWNYIMLLQHAVFLFLTLF